LQLTDRQAWEQQQKVDNERVSAIAFYKENGLLWGGESDPGTFLASFYHGAHLFPVMGPDYNTTDNATVECSQCHYKHVFTLQCSVPPVALESLLNTERFSLEDQLRPLVNDEFQHRMWYNTYVKPHPPHCVRSYNKLKFSYVVDIGPVLVVNIQSISRTTLTEAQWVRFLQHIPLLLPLQTVLPGSGGNRGGKSIDASCSYELTGIFIHSGGTGLVPDGEEYGGGHYTNLIRFPGPQLWVHSSSGRGQPWGYGPPESLAPKLTNLNGYPTGVHYMLKSAENKPLPWDLRIRRTNKHPASIFAGVVPASLDIPETFRFCEGTF
jgi:hypothetical protein